MITSINEFRKIYELCEGDMEDMLSIVRSHVKNDFEQLHYGFDYIEIKLKESDYEKKEKFSQDIIDELLKKFDKEISEVYSEETGWFKIYLTHDVKESRKKNDGIDLVIVDVQEQYKQYFSERYVVELQKYCEDFKRVFQIWDSKDTDKTDYVFPNQVATYEKQYGKELRLDNVEQFFTQAMWHEIKKKLELVPDEGDMFETINGEAWVYIENKHKWFLCPKDMCKLFKDFVRQQRQIILVGGAANECLQDIIVTMKAFGVKVSYDMKFVYSKEGSYFSKMYQPTEEDLQAIKDKEDKHLKKKEKKPSV